MTLPITDYPTIVKRNLVHFQDLFTKPQLSHFAEYLSGLMLCINLTIKGINNSFVGHRDQSAKERFLVSSPWPEQKVNQRRLGLILKQVSPLNPNKCYLVVDDVLTHKTGKHMEEVGRYKDHTNNSYTLGHVLVTTHHLSAKGHFPIGDSLYKQRANKEDPEFRSKIELAKQLVKEASNLQLPFKTVLFDSWYFCKGLTSFVESLDKNWVAGCKSNRVLLVNNKRIPVRDFIETLSKQAYKKTTIEGQDYFYFTKSFKMSRQGKVRLLVCYDNAALQGDPVILATNKLGWEARRIIMAYKGRWTIETFYRDSKQNLGLEDYELRDLKGIKRHWCLVFLAYTLLQLSSLDKSLRRWLRSNVGTIGSKCRLSFQETVRSFILFILKQNSLKRNPDEIFTIIFSSRAEIGRRFRFA